MKFYSINVKSLHAGEKVQFFNGVYELSNGQRSKSLKNRKRSKRVQSFCR